MKNLWRKFLAWVKSLPVAYIVMFVAGFVLSTFFCIALGMDVCIIPAIFAGFIAAFFKMWFSDTGNFAWQWLVACVIGGVLPQLFVLLHYLWFVW